MLLSDIGECQKRDGQNKTRRSEAQGKKQADKS